MGKHILVVGAGYAGILTAKKLAKRLKRREDITITVVDKNPYHAMLTELHEVAANRVDEESIRISLQKVFAGRKVDLRLDTIESFDFDKQLAIGQQATYSYDYLVLSAGSKPTFFGVKGAEEYAFKLWSYDDAIRIRHQILNMFRKACKEPDPEVRRKTLTFFIVGAGFTGVEMAGELAEYVPIITRKFEIDPREVSITIVDVLDRTIPNLPPELSVKVERRLKKMNVHTMLSTNVVGIGPDYIEVKQGETVARHSASTIIWGAGIESADITGEAAKVLQSANRNRIKIDTHLRSLDYPNVFVIGDNMLYTPDGEERPVPQIVENCEQSAAVAARNLIALIEGKDESALTAYQPKFHGFMVCIGGRYGVARVGLPNHMVNLPSFFAMFAKHFINMIYFIQVLGWNKVFSYMKHEFFTIRHERSFVGGHFSNRTPSFLLVPLRVWLGMVWLYEGIMKVVEKWLEAPMLKDFFGGANAWFDSVLKPAAAGAAQVAEAATSATGGGGGGGGQLPPTVLINWDFLGLIRTIFVSGKPLEMSKLSDFAFKFDIPLMNWFVDHVVLASSGMQLFMQISIVVMEILIGLALIGGLFTFPAAGLSLILQFMFVCTTGLFLGTFWMIFAAIAVLVGGGRTFGLDYYAMPALKRAWAKTGVARKLYVYHD